MRRMILFMLPVVALLAPLRSAGQDFRQAAVPVTHRIITFTLKTPIVHLSKSPYAPSENTVFVGTTTFRFTTHPTSAIFLKLQWDMDASDGVAFSDMYNNQDEPAVATHTYATPGKKTIVVHMEMYNLAGQRQEDTKTIEIYVAPAPSAAYQDSHGNSLYYWEGSDGAYDRPVLVVEGFDPENTLDPLGSYAQGFDLAEQARGEGYDMLFLNFASGGGDVAANKDVFLGACRFAHDKLRGREAAVQVIGVSMGGTVARYGLAWAEDQTRRGNVTEHYVNTFISFDAPQQGAHINVGLQNFLKDRGTAEQQSTLQSAAARELLYENTYGSLHDSFYESLSNLNAQEDQIVRGYPRLCRNFAVSNGNFTSPYPDKVAGEDQLATLTIYKEITVMFVDIDYVAVDEVIPIPCEIRDLWPGSLFTDDLRKISGSGSTREYFAGFPFSLLASGFGHWEFRVHFNPSYQPTEAALDLKGYYRTADGSIAGGSTLFDETLVQATTHRHEEVTDDSRVKVMSWLNGYRTFPYIAVPQNVQASMIAGNAIQVSFSDPSVFNDGVVVERKAEGGTFAAIATLGPDATTYADWDPALQPFTRYVYRVRSVSAQRSSSFSREVAVVYQPHLVSSTAGALAGGSQRKALQTTAAMNNRFMAYESAGGSYLVRFIEEDLGSGAWESERPIGGVPGPTLEYRSPSLFADSAGAVPRVVFEEVNTALGTRAIRHAMFDEATQSLYVYPEPLSSLEASPGYQSMPVAAMTDAAPNKPASLMAAAWRYEPANGLALGIGVFDEQGAFRWSTVDLNGGVLGVAVTAAANPSIAALLQSAGKLPAYHVYLAWEEENHAGVLGGIRLLHGRYTPGGQPWPPAAAQIVWESGQPFAVAQNSAAEVHRRPSVAVDATGNVVVAWESAASSTGKILVQKRNAYTSAVVAVATTTIATGAGNAAPRGASIADFRSVPGMGDNLAVAWYSEGGGSCAAWYAAGANAWSAPRLLDAAARQPSIAVTKSASPESRVVASSGSSGPPYAIRALSAGPLPPPLPAPPLSWQSVLINNVKRARLAWGAVGPDLQAYDVYMYTCDVGAGDCGGKAFHALQTTTTALTYTDINTVVFTKTAASLTPDRTNYYYVRARDRFSQSGLSSAKVAVNTDEPMAWKSPAGGADGDLPRRYALSENFPNPFNPSTAFRYELPAAGEVRIAVYNMIGEEVMTLVDLPHEAGYYEALWDASASPSGVYVAVMRVSGPGGRLAYSAVRKVVLVR